MGKFPTIIINHILREITKVFDLIAKMKTFLLSNRSIIGYSRDFLNNNDVNTLHDIINDESSKKKEGIQVTWVEVPKCKCMKNG